MHGKLGCKIHTDNKHQYIRIPGIRNPPVTASTPEAPAWRNKNQISGNESLALCHETPLVSIHECDPQNALELLCLSSLWGVGFAGICSYEVELVYLKIKILGGHVLRN